MFPTLNVLRRSRAVVLVTIALLLAIPASMIAVTQRAHRADALATNAGELDFMMRTNALRTGKGLAPLALDNSLAAYARDWSATMSATNTLAHDPGYIADGLAALGSTGWTVLGENVGRGGDVLTVFNGFVASPAHYANLVDGRYNRIGIGVVNRTDGLYVTMRFATATAGIGTGSDPVGAIDTARWSGPNQITVGGWALDPDTTAPIPVHVYLDGVVTGLAANGSRPDVAWAFPGYQSAHGFQATLSAGPGTHTVCFYGINLIAGTNALLGCRSVTIPTASLGALDLVSPGTGNVRVAGWALDPDTAVAINIVVTIDGVWVSVPSANLWRNDIFTLFATWGGNHGYDLTVPAARGSRQVCTWATNIGAGSGALLGCRQVTIG